MTDKQKRERMCEIDKIRDELREELREYECYFREKDIAEERKRREAFIGKCFLKKDVEFEHEDIIGFKILKIRDEVSNPSADCIVILENYNVSITGVVKMHISPWSDDILYKLPRCAPKIIDFYNEVSEEEFNNVADKYRC